jgi:oxaloacetate decarboxylase alpha subunit
MSENKIPLGITDVVLRDAHQSLLATRMRIDDMLPIAEKLDQVGFWSLESWGLILPSKCFLEGKIF